MVRTMSLWTMVCYNRINNCFYHCRNKTKYNKLSMEKKKQINNYPMKDYQDMLELFRWVGPLREEQQNLIWDMLKKYIDPHHPKPISGCNCSLSYGSAFNRLRDWCSLNGNKFQ